MPAYALILLFLSLLCADQSLGARLGGTHVDLLEGGLAEGNDAPWFCRGSPCPPFKVISKEQTYELREYSKSTDTFAASSNFLRAICYELRRLCVGQWLTWEVSLQLPGYLPSSTPATMRCKIVSEAHI